jgi:DNA polymerase-3 subunit alpha
VDTSVSELEGCRDGAVVWVGGLATSVRVNTTRKGDMMAMMQLDDTRGLAEVMVFPRVYAKFASAVREDAVVRIKGRVETKEGVPRVMAMEVEELDLKPGLDPLYLSANSFVGMSRSEAAKAFDVLSRFPGGSPLILVSGDGKVERQICTVEDSGDLHAELKRVLGLSGIGYTRPEAPDEESSPAEAVAMGRVS